MNKRGKPSLQDKILNKRNKTCRVNISISIPQTLLTKIEDNIKSNNRSRKLVRCLEEGYRSLTQ